jgi:hypothetical protein
MEEHFTGAANLIFRAALLESSSMQPPLAVDLRQTDTCWRVSSVVHLLHKKLGFVQKPQPSKKTVAVDLWAAILHERGVDQDMQEALETQCSLLGIDEDSACTIECSLFTHDEEYLRDITGKAANSVYRSACSRASCGRRIHNAGLTVNLRSERHEDMCDIASTLYNKLRRFGNTKTKHEFAQEIWALVQSKLDTVPSHRFEEKSGKIWLDWSCPLKIPGMAATAEAAGGTNAAAAAAAAGPAAVVGDVGESEVGESEVGESGAEPTIAVCISGAIRSFPRDCFRKSFEQFRTEMPPFDCFMVLKTVCHRGSIMNSREAIKQVRVVSGLQVQ